MTFSYKLTEEDHVGYFWFVNKAEARRIWIFYPLFFLVLVYFVLAESIEEGNLKADEIFMIIFLSMLFYKILSPWSKPGIRKKLRKILMEGRSMGLLGLADLTFNDTCIILRTEFVESRMEWASICSLDESAKHLCITLVFNDALVIPKRVFYNEQELQDLKTLIKRKLTRTDSKNEG